MESYSFVVLASLVGMGIVFAFLTLLSLLMVAMRSIDRGDASQPLGTDHPAHPSTEITHSPARALPSWAVAAAVVYLDAERELEQGSASVWTGRGR